MNRPGIGQSTLSVCIPTLGRPSLTTTAIPSVLAQAEIDQLVIAGHGLTVRLGNPLRQDDRVKIVRFDGGTVGGVRNAAAAEATGDLLVFLDDDDELTVGAAARFREMLADPTHVFASGAVAVFDGGSLQRVALPERLVGLYHGMTANFLAGSFALRRSLFEQVGGYNEDLAFGENYDLGIRIARAIQDDSLGYGWTDDVVVRVAPSGVQYRDEQAAAAAFTLDSYTELLADLPQQRATLHAILGVYEWRRRHRRLARRHLRQALRAWPRDPRHALRLALSAVSPLADRRWQP